MSAAATPPTGPTQPVQPLPPVSGTVTSGQQPPGGKQKVPLEAKWTVAPAKGGMVEYKLTVHTRPAGPDEDVEKYDLTYTYSKDVETETVVNQMKAIASLFRSVGPEQAKQIYAKINKKEIPFSYDITTPKDESGRTGTLHSIALVFPPDTKEGKHYIWTQSGDKWYKQEIYADPKDTEAFNKEVARRSTEGSGFWGGDRGVYIIDPALVKASLPTFTGIHGGSKLKKDKVTPTPQDITRKDYNKRVAKQLKKMLGEKKAELKKRKAAPNLTGQVAGATSPPQTGAVTVTSASPPAGMFAAHPLSSEEIVATQAASAAARVLSHEPPPPTGG